MTGIPVRTELAVLPADGERKVIGWSVSEHVGVGVFNPKAVTKLTVDPGTFLFRRPVPGHSDFWLEAVFRDGRIDVELHAEGRPDPVKDACTFGEGGLEWPIKANVANMTDAVRLCQETMSADGLSKSSPGFFELMKDRFWQRFLDELPGAFVTASVLTT